jgi:hypothetical protein
MARPQCDTPLVWIDSIYYKYSVIQLNQASLNQIWPSTGFTQEGEQSTLTVLLHTCYTFAFLKEAAFSGTFSSGGNVIQRPCFS